MEGGGKSCVHPCSQVFALIPVTQGPGPALISPKTAGANATRLMYPVLQSEIEIRDKRDAVSLLLTLSHDPGRSFLPHLPSDWCQDSSCVANSVGIF